MSKDTVPPRLTKIVRPGKTKTDTGEDTFAEQRALKIRQRIETAVNESLNRQMPQFRQQLINEIVNRMLFENKPQKKS